MAGDLSWPPDFDAWQDRQGLHISRHHNLFGPVPWCHLSTSVICQRRSNNGTAFFFGIVSGNPVFGVRAVAPRRCYWAACCWRAVSQPQPLTLTPKIPWNILFFRHSHREYNVKIYMGPRAGPYRGESETSKGAVQLLKECHIWLPQQTRWWSFDLKQNSKCWDTPEKNISLEAYEIFCEMLAKWQCLGVGLFIVHIV